MEYINPIYSSPSTIIKYRENEQHMVFHDTEYHWQGRKKITKRWKVSEVRVFPEKVSMLLCRKGKSREWSVDTLNRIRRQKGNPRRPRQVGYI